MFVGQSVTMHFRCLVKICITAFFVYTGTFCAYAQPNTNVDLDKQKPKQYTNRKLGSERTGEKKFTLPRRITQNTYTHYNYYFNANNKLNGVIEKAKLASKEDYTKLLPFYNYTLDGTAQSKDDLDSVIYKCTAGILLHDLRNDWIDNLYLLLGRAYMLRKDFDSAAGCFQYINYVYAPKDDGYDVPLGSSSSGTKGVFTISTNEKRNLWKKLTTTPPSRNESFVWQIRNYLEQDLIGEASGLIGILRSDPYFPKRLKTDLHEMTAFWFYKQENYDSAAWHLQQSLDNAEDKAERARWEFLAAQMYQIAAKDSQSLRMYEKAIQHTTDPLMEVYARLNIVSLASGKKKDALQENINELKQLAKKDKYDAYRDIIYYAAAKLELKRDGFTAAEGFLQKSIKYSVSNPAQKSLSFLMLGDISYVKKKFIDASAHYDSVQVETLKTLAEAEQKQINLRKPALKIISEALIGVNKEDSLQKIALMPEAERTAFVKKLSKDLRKAKGIKIRDESDFGSAGVIDNKATDLFGNNDAKGEWYFLNSGLKTKGLSEFKTRWGKRPNVDNWRRQAVVEQNVKVKSDPVDFSGDVVEDVATTKKGGGDKKGDAGDKGDTKEAAEEDISYEGMMSRLPLTPERLEVSTNKIQIGLFKAAETFQNMLEEYDEAADLYINLLGRYTNFKARENTLFNLYYCYTKLGLTASADSVKKVMEASYPDGTKTELLQKKKEAEPKEAASATKEYERIYTLFIEGKFEEAKAAKELADKKYPKSTWNTQLLFIEAVYYMKQKQDSTALVRLKDIVQIAGSTPLAIKAQNLIEVLQKRKEIEDYLTNLQVERHEEEVSKPVDLNTPTKTSTAIETKTTNVVKEVTPKVIDKKVESTTVTNTIAGYTFVVTDAQYAMVIFNEVDKVFTSEAKGAFDGYNREKYYSLRLNSSLQKLDDKITLLLIGPFENAGKAVDYLDKVRPVASASLISWIPAAKYSYGIISNPNLTMLTQQKNLPEYMGLLKQLLPGKF